MGDIVQPFYPNKVGIPKISGGAQQYSIPGAFVTTVGTSALNVNEVRYVLINALYQITLNAWSLEVTAAPAGNANIRVGVYAADTNQQPSGAPVYDSGAVAVASGFTGVKSASGLSVVLTPGTYLVCINTDTAMTLRTFVSGGYGLIPTIGASPVIQRMTVAQTFGAFPNPGALWTAVTTAGVGMQHFSIWQWTE